MPLQKSGLRLHQVILRVKDLERSKQFYTKMLGFKVKYDFSPEYLAVVTPNRLQIGFHRGNQSWSRTAQGDQPLGTALELEAGHALYEKLKKLAVKCIDKRTNTWGDGETRLPDPRGHPLATSRP